MSGTIIMGYDVEAASESTLGFLSGAQEFHRNFGLPWTIYLTDQTVEACADGIRLFVDDPVLAVGQDTYRLIGLQQARYSLFCSVKLHLQKYRATNP